MTAEDGKLQPDVLRVVSVSLGSSKRDHTAEAEMLGRRILIQRIGVDGDLDRARALIAELDGKVAAMGLGGMDIALVAGKKHYVIEEARRVAAAAKVTPIVDGNGLKNTLERETIRWLDSSGMLPLRGRRVLVVSAVDRFGMAEAFAEAGAQTIYGDLIFALGIPIPMRSLRVVRFAAALLLPFLRRLPMRMLYPTGKEQERTNPRYQRFFAWAEVIAGDFHYIRRSLPLRADGKVIVTNTTTAEDVALLRERGVSMLVTTTPQFGGRSFGTNVMEAVLLALAGKRAGEMQPEEYMDLLRRLGWKPNVERLTAGSLP